MRSFKLTIQAIAAAALLALAPAASATRGHQHVTSGKRSGGKHHIVGHHGAGSHEGHGVKALNHPRANTPNHPGVNTPAIGGGGGCRISIFAEPHTVTSESVQLFGQLRCRPGTEDEKQTVTIFERVAGSSTFTTLGTATTKEGEHGFYSLVDSSVTSDTTFYASALGVRSLSTKVKVAPTIELESPPSPKEGAELLTGRNHAVAFAGKVSPEDRGAEVVLQRENSVGSENWGDIQRPIFVGAGGRFAFMHTFVVPGDADIRVIVRPHGKFTVRGISTPISYQISQAQNPLLTLSSSKDSILSGEKIELTGKLKAGSGQKVVLLSHPRGVPGFTKVEEATTTTEGAYTFSQTPKENTFYQVSGPGNVHSAVLFEGVRDVLTPNPPPTTIKQGETVTFTGTVSPSHEGEPVYLEHANLFGGGYHVVGVGSVGSGGSYSVSRTFLGTGKQTLRIKVPGNPANQATASAPFTIEVTPAPLPLLKPAPASRLPSEGQV
jgi:hypothetical protein